MVDMAEVINSLVPQANYRGSATGWAKEKYDNLRWKDGRGKPTWQEMKDERERIQNEPEPPSPESAMKELVAYYTQLNNDDSTTDSEAKKQGRKQLNEFLSPYPGAQSALQLRNYSELRGSDGYLQIAVDDTNLSDFDSGMKNDIVDILDGKTSYL